MNPSRSILVIGSNSFSGSDLVNGLLSRGERVVGISRSPEVESVFSRYHKNQNLGNFTFHQININHDFSEIADLCLAANVKTIINFSAQSMVAQSWITPEDWYQTNVVGLAKLTSEISQRVELERFIQVSTPEVYGNTLDWVEESFHFKPTTPYAISRAAGDLHLKSLWESFSFPVIFTRAANVFGASQQLYRIVPKTVLCGLLGRKVPLQGGGTSIRSFIHIRDVSNAIIKIMDSGRLGDTYHISTDKLITIKELIEKVSQELDIDTNNLVEVSSERPGKDYAYKLSSMKLRSELGWVDQVTLEEGIQETIEWAKENLVTLSTQSDNYVHKR